MALQLMAMCDDNQLSTLAPEDDFWRNCLNIPSKRTVNDALKQSVRARGVKVNHELDLAWNDVWKPQLLTWFVLIDDDFVEKKPSYRPALGRYWYPLLTNEPQEAKSGVSKSRKRNKKETAEAPEQTLQKPSASGKKVGRSKKHEGVPVDPSWDYPLIRYSQSSLRKCWDIPVSRPDRLLIWNEAVLLLSDGTTKQEQTARQFVGKLIKDFGEAKVAAAVATLLVRTPKPADPKSFLRKQLKNATEGSESVQAARAQRAKVPL
mgnify:CR=1 FL=1